LRGNQKVAIKRMDIKKSLWKYLKKHLKEERQVYPSDVADALGLKYETVRKIFHELERKGKILERQ
jgi:ribosomal protein S25